MDDQETKMTAEIRVTARLLVVAAIFAVLMAVSGAVAVAQEEQLYPLPEETPVTQVVADVAEAEARPVTGVLPSDLARTGFDISAALALGALLVLVGGGIVAADRWYRQRQVRAFAG
jgi:hypothetical protein